MNTLVRIFKCLKLNKSHFHFSGILTLILFFNSCVQEKNLLVSDTTNSMIASTIVFSQQPSSGIAASVLSQQPKISILDSSGKKLISGPDAWAQINLAITNGNGNIIGTHSTYAVLGEAIFTNIAIDQTGLKSLTATKVDMSAYGGSASLTAESSNFLISAGTGTKLIYSAPAFFDAGVCVSSTIAIADGGNNLVSATTSINVDLLNPGLGSFYSDANCSTAVSSTTILTNSTSRTIYYRNFVQESLNVIFTDPLSQYASTSYQSYVKPTNLKEINLYQFGIRQQCDLFDAGFVNCQLYNSFSSSVSFKQFYFTSPVSQVVVTKDENPCFLSVDETLKCKLGETTTSVSGTYNSLIAGVDHNCALSTSSTTQLLYCWGSNANRQLGDGTNLSKVNPTLINLGLSPGVTIKKLFVQMSGLNTNRTFALLSNGEVVVWGGGNSNVYNPKFINGISNVKDLQSKDDGFNTVYALLDNGTIQEFSLNYGSIVGNTINTSAPNTLPGFANIEKFAANVNGQVCGIDVNNILYCMGERGSQTGLGFYVPVATQMFNFPVDSIVSGQTEFCAVTLNDRKKAVCWNEVEDSPRIEPTFTSLTAAVEKIKFSTNNIILYPDQCKLLSLQYYYNNLEKLASFDILLNLNDLSNEGQFYSDANCSQSITSKVIHASISQRNIYYKANSYYSDPKYVFLEAVPSTSGTATGHLTLIIPGNASKIKAYGEANIPNECKPASIGAYDQNYNPTYLTKTNPITLNFSLSSGNGKIYSNANCTAEINTVNVPAFNFATTVYVKFFDSCGFANFNVSSTGLETGTFSIGQDCGCD